MKQRLIFFMLLVCGAIYVVGCSSTSTDPDPGPVACTEPYCEITTFAGTGIAGSNGWPLYRDTELFTPQDMTIAPDGTIYILDWNNHRVLQGNAGSFASVCGTGTLGDAPEGTATLAGLNHPTHINVDPQGRLIMSAWHNSMIMRIDLSNDALTRVAGQRPLEGTNSNRCYDIDNEGTAATASCLDLPVATAFDSAGDLYVSDQKNVRIAKISAVGGVITDNEESGEQSTMVTIAGVPTLVGFNGNGILATEALLSAPGGQSADPTSRIIIHNDVLYIADTDNHMVRKIDLTVENPTIERVAGGGPADVAFPGYSGDGGPATDSRLNRPCDMAFDSEDNLFIADTWNNVIRRIDAVTGIITTFAGRGLGNPDPFPEDPTDGAAFGDGGAPLDAYLSRPYGLAIDSSDNIYIVDTYHHRVRVIYK